MFYNSVIWHYGVAVTFSSPLGMVKRQGVPRERHWLKCHRFSA